MSDSLTISGIVGAHQHRASSGYAGSQQVERQAAVTRPNDGPEFKAAVNKLQRVLDADRPLRDDVPRGFYLNVLI